MLFREAVAVYYESSVQNFARRCGRADSLRSFIWGRVSGLKWFRDGSDKRTASNFVQMLEWVRRRLWQWWDKRSENKTWAVHRKFKLTEIEKRRDSWRAIKSILISSLTSKGLFTKNLFWQVKQSIQHPTATFYGDCMKMWEDFA
jgi:hypothetical protein